MLTVVYQVHENGRRSLSVKGRPQDAYTGGAVHALVYTLASWLKDNKDVHVGEWCWIYLERFESLVEADGDEFLQQIFEMTAFGIETIQMRYPDAVILERRNLAVPATRQNRIRELRETKKLSQTKLAEEAGISRPFLSNIETGSAAPTITVAKRIAEALGVTLDEAFGEVR